MNLDLTPTPTSTKSTDDTEIDDNSQDTSPLSYTNGAQKNHHQQPPLPPAYKECMKNHAASIGGHAVDGCGEFMPTPSTNPTSLKCAACGCHRNFHRREPESPAAAITPPFLDFRHPHLPAKRFSLSSSPPPPHPPPPAAVAPTPYAPHFLFSLSTGEEHHQAPVTPTAENPVGSRKRFRSKFSQEQKEKMHSFSEKLGWKMHKSDEAAVKDFCHEIGVTKGVLKVWMHNNKSTFGRKEIHGGGGGGDTTKSEERKTHNNGGHFQNYESGNGAHFQSSNNGSSSSL